MAITKIIGPIHMNKQSKYKSLERTINYICNPDKTNNFEYVGSNNCEIDNALNDFIDTYKLFNKEPKSKRDRLAYHLCISWSPDENVSCEQALNVLSEFCKVYIPNYESVYSVHNDKGHMHGHICFNAVNCFDGYKYRYNKNDWEKSIQPIVDQICSKNGLKKLEDDTGVSLEQYSMLRDNNKIKQPKDNVRHSNNKYYNEKNEKYSLNDYLRDDLDYFINVSNSFDDFITKLKANGYQVRMGKSRKYGTYTAIKCEGMDRYRRTYALGSNYSDNMIINRISINKKESNIYNEEEIRYFIPKRFFRVKIHYNYSNPFIRNKFYYIYKFGIGKANIPRPNYKAVKHAIINIDKLQYQLEVLEKGTDVPYVEQCLKKSKKDIKDINIQITEKKKSIKSVNHMIRTYSKYNKMLLDIKSDYVYVDMKEFNRIKDVIDSYIHSEKDLIRIKKEYKDDISYLKNKRKTLIEKENAVSELLQELSDKEYYKNVISEEEFNKLDIELLNNDEERTKTKII